MPVGVLVPLPMRGPCSQAELMQGCKQAQEWGKTQGLKVHKPGFPKSGTFQAFRSWRIDLSRQVSMFPARAGLPRAARGLNHKRIIWKIQKCPETVKYNIPKIFLIYVKYIYICPISYFNPCGCPLFWPLTKRHNVICFCYALPSKPGSQPDSLSGSRALV